MRQFRKHINEWLELAPGLEDCWLRVHETVHPEVVCPNSALTFRAMEYFAPQDTQVVILGQDPYHTSGKASGLAFGYNRTYEGPIDSSLMNIIDELHAGTPDSDMIQVYETFPTHLEHWARQGVLLLNTKLSVIEGKPMSHANMGWELEILKCLKILNTISSRIVWVAWGAEARKLIGEIAPANFVYTSHPCKYSNTATSSPFTGSNCFGRVNDILELLGKEPIKWI